MRWRSACATSYPIATRSRRFVALPTLGRRRSSMTTTTVILALRRRVVTGRMRHVRVALSFCLHAVETGHIVVRFCPSAEQLADFLTNSLGKYVIAVAPSCPTADWRPLLISRARRRLSFVLLPPLSVGEHFFFPSFSSLAAVSCVCGFAVGQQSGMDIPSHGLMHVQ